jgi:Leucine-rich repeat (LRR) protein
MKKLNLEQNNIRKIEAETYKGVPRLKSLKLGNNNIRKIHPQAMTDLSYLETLTLNNNKIRKLNNGVFSNLKKLYSIDLSRNKIRLIGEDMFLGLDKLEDLLISGNKLNSVHKLAFRALPNLNSLDLKENRLVSFNFSTVTNMPQLTIMDLSKNHLFWVDIPSTAYLRLKDLLLSDNSLQSLSSNIDNIMGRSSIISLMNNPWTCDCQLKWVLEHSKNVRLDTTTDVMCKSPPELHGKKVHIYYTQILHLNTVVHSSKATLTKDHTCYQNRFQIHLESNMLQNCLLLFPRKRWHPSFKTILSLQKGWPYKRGYCIL